MDVELKCNNVNCRKRIVSSKVCVTSCSHLFCVECAQESFQQALICPACGTSLTQRNDLVMNDLNPSEEYKASILAGLRPEIIMDIAGRAISFWVYQSTQEICYQEAATKTLEEKLNQIQRESQSLAREAAQEIQGYEEKLNLIKRDFETEKKKNHELNEHYSEKCRQLHKLQSLYDKMKRKELTQLKSTTDLGLSSSAKTNQGLANSTSSNSLLGQDKLGSQLGGILSNFRQGNSNSKFNSTNNSFSSSSNAAGLSTSGPNGGDGNSVSFVEILDQKQQNNGLHSVPSSMMNYQSLGSSNTNNSPFFVQRPSPFQRTKSLNVQDQEKENLISPELGLFTFQSSQQQSHSTSSGLNTKLF